MNKFIEITDMREPVGVEQIKGRIVLLNVDHIGSIDELEPHIAKEVGYNTFIQTTTSRHYVAESIIEIKENIWKRLNLNLD